MIVFPDEAYDALLVVMDDRSQGRTEYFHKKLQENFDKRKYIYYQSSNYNAEELWGDIEQKLDRKEIILPVSQRVIFCNYIDLADVNEKWLQRFRERMRVFKLHGMVDDMSQHYHLNFFRYQVSNIFDKKKQREVFEVLSHLWDMEYQYMCHSEFLVYAGGLRPNLAEQEKGMVRLLGMLSIHDYSRVIDIGQFEKSLCVFGETEYYERHAQKCEEGLQKLNSWLQQANDTNINDFASNLDNIVSRWIKKLEERLQIFQKEAGLYPMNVSDYREERRLGFPRLIRRKYIRPEAIPQRLRDEKKKEIIAVCDLIKNSSEKGQWKKNLVLQLHYPDLLQLSQEWEDGTMKRTLKNSIDKYKADLKSGEEELSTEECEVFQKAIYSWIEEFAQENLMPEKIGEMKEDKEGKKLQLEDEFRRASIFPNLMTCFSRVKESTEFRVPSVILPQEIGQIAIINSKIGKDWEIKGYDITGVRDDQIAVMNNLYPYEIVYMKFGKYIDLTGEQTEKQLKMVFS